MKRIRGLGGLDFDASALQAPIAAEDADDGPAQALRKLLQGQLPLPPVARGPWRRVADAGDEVLFIGGDPRRRQAVLVKNHAPWAVESVAYDFKLRRTWPGCGRAATWKLETEPAPDATEVHLLVTELECASGQSCADRIEHTEVQYLDDRIEITVFVRAIGGKCISNPAVALQLALEEPVGRRRLLDGGDAG